MNYEKKWEILGELGEGGQGKVYRVFNKNEIKISHNIFVPIDKFIKSFINGRSAEIIKGNLKDFREAINEINKIENPLYNSALKVLHKPSEARDSENAVERIKREITGMNEVSHPNLLKIIDYDTDEEWFVSEYHHKKTLIDNKDRFTGNLVESIKAFRQLVEGVSELHSKGFIHRDIKPQNIFVNQEDNLVLGDFGLVYFSDEGHTRMSGSFENVGSRDWMPGWAQGKKLEEINPTFDVFSLGKLLWAMISNKPILQLWYYDKDEYDLEKMFPKAKGIKFLNELFKKCIVEEERSCIPDASKLLEEVDEVISKIGMNADIISLDIARKCKVCGAGEYRLSIDKNLTNIRNFGLQPAGNQYFRIFECSYCGNIQLFSAKREIDPPAWQK